MRCPAHTTKQSAPARRIGTFGVAVGAACAFSLGIADQVLTFRTRAWLSFAPPTWRMPLGQSQDDLQADPRGGASRFARACVRVGHNKLLPESLSEEWLLIEWPKGEAEPTNYWLSTLPAASAGSSILPNCAGVSSATTRSSSRRSGLVTMKAAD